MASSEAPGALNTRTTEGFPLLAEVVVDCKCAISSFAALAGEDDDEDEDGGDDKEASVRLLLCLLPLKEEGK
eukprot:CAMPEP_0205960374 /NCGR_PEP_ID=MMETSP1459-20131121/61156_1 /ASSEMBLY_ACC=CAM_ASM_001120 /TAXON_ID=41880 /ORGANISM="Pycnococcus provasolii, Strain RCC931" /LENGTH=71 /DNA_ID=CAMNT_0053333025 /DNA_START=30 /DNA_END=242 /DNA_ORIENTATION=+